MAGEIKLNGTTALTESSGAVTLNNVNSATNRTNLGLGTAATSAAGDFEAFGAVSTHATVTSGIHGISAFGATLVDDADAATARTTLGLGTAATSASTDFVGSSRTITAGTGLSGGGDLSTNRTINVSFSANESNVKTAINASGSAPIYACRAWVNFNGTGTVAIRASGNVSSLTDNGTGDYTINFATAMPDANYSVTATGMRNSTYAANANPIVVALKSNTTYSNNVTTSGFSITTHWPTDASNQDPIAVCISVFR